jgi:deoxyadenosine/deoxycytidine kinase
MKYLIITTLLLVLSIKSLKGQSGYICLEKNREHFLENVFLLNRKIECKSFQHYIVYVDEICTQYYYFNNDGKLFKTVIEIKTKDFDVEGYMSDFEKLGFKREFMEEKCDWTDDMEDIWYSDCILTICYDGE